jgi:hypothetical protein
MSSISLEAFDGELRGKLSQWILPNDICALPNGFQDQLMSGTNPFQTHILLTTKQESKAWLLAYTWDLTYMPETSTDWSLLLSILGHLKKPILIVTTPKCSAPTAFWQKCATLQPAPTGAILSEISEAKQSVTPPIPNTAFFPKLDYLSEAQFMKAQNVLHPMLQQTIQKLDLRSLYRELRGAGASLCLSSINSRTISDYSFNSMWFYPEINGALRLQVSDLRMILRTVTERLAEP